MSLKAYFRKKATAKMLSEFGAEKNPPEGGFFSAWCLLLVFCVHKIHINASVREQFAVIKESLDPGEASFDGVGSVDEVALGREGEVAADRACIRLPSLGRTDEKAD